MRTIYCTDAIEWMKASPILTGCSIVASMPDVSEFPKFSLDEWKVWFIQTACLIMSRCPDEGVILFYQTDIKVDGIWLDKAYLCQKAAESSGHSLLWHKLVCRVPAGVITFGKPSYTHLLCFSKGLSLDLSKSTADIIPEIGEKTWQRGMGLKACLFMAQFVAEQTNTKTIVHPFCGEGSMLAAANFMNLRAIGIERSQKRAARADRINIASDGSSWVWRET
ncbi:MAG: SAM-dependent methyltransferase [Bdellovibrio sp.]|nr:SAM-dependent methyltransferase [Bdellovibrio sp.]